MTKQSIRAAMDRRRDFFESLASSTYSIQELMLKVSVYGGKWTKTDWMLFFAYLQYEAELPRPAGGAAPVDSIMESLLESIGRDKAVDAIVTNSDMVRMFVQGAKYAPKAVGKFGLDLTAYVPMTCLTILARTVAAHPEVWNMNYMWTRHKGGGRTHKLAEFAKARLNRGPKWAESDAARQDFASMFWLTRFSGNFLATGG